jgi:hypothetical protein
MEVNTLYFSLILCMMRLFLACLQQEAVKMRPIASTDLSISWHVTT